MAKSSKPTKAQQRVTALQQRQQLAEWTLNGRSPEMASKLGILDMWGSPSPTDKKNAQIELKAVSDEVVALKEKAIALWKKDENNALELGKVLWQIKAVSEHGEFTKWWTKAGFEQSRVSYCLRLAAPSGNKVQTAKERLTQSPRAKTMRMMIKKLAKLYDLGEAGEREKAQELYKEIVEQLRERFLAKAKAAAA